MWINGKMLLKNVLIFQETNWNACTQLHNVPVRKSWGKVAAWSESVHTKNILHLLFLHLRFLQCCYLRQANIISSSLSHVFGWSCSLCLHHSFLSIHSFAFVLHFFFLFIFVVVRLCSGIMCVQSTIVPLSRAGKHTICESAVYSTSVKWKHETNSLHRGIGVSVFYDRNCFQYEQLLWRAVHKLFIAWLIVCVFFFFGFFFRLSLLCW